MWALIAVCVYVGSAIGQTDPGFELEPVDQTVSDLDLRARSFRRVEQGIGVYGQAGSLYRRADHDPWSPPSGDPAARQYQLRLPGVQAWLDRPDYLVRTGQGEVLLNVAPANDRQFIDLIPPNTVFDLVPRSYTAGAVYAEPVYGGWRDTRIGHRIGAPLDTALTAQDSRQGGPGQDPKPQVMFQLVDWPTRPLLRTAATQPSTTEADTQAADSTARDVDQADTSAVEQDDTGDVETHH